jgi:hypothetical protein
MKENHEERKAEKLSKAEIARIGNKTAAPIRNLPSEKRKLPVKVLDPDGKVIRETTRGDLQASILARAGVEFSRVELPPDLTKCSLCDELATPGSVKRARLRGTKPYCEIHKRKQVKRIPLPCSVCKAPSTRESSKGARRGNSKAYCQAHSPVVSRRIKEVVICSLCTSPASKSSAFAFRKGLSKKAYCKDHKRGRVPSTPERSDV